MGTSTAIVGSIVMGSGIAAMHYIGMEAMRLPAMCSYSPVLVAVVAGIGNSYLLRCAVACFCFAQCRRLKHTKCKCRHPGSGYPGDALRRYGGSNFVPAPLPCPLSITRSVSPTWASSASHWSLS